MLINTKEMFKIALANKFAVGAFNFANMEVLQGIVAGSAITQSPLILQVVPKAIEYAGLPYIVKMVEAALQKCDLPVVLHLDHGDSYELCKECIDAGFTSVMIDGSHLPYHENAALIKKVCDYGHSRDDYVTVEAELGIVAGSEGEGADNDGTIGSVTDVVQALDFIAKTTCDSLAIACGTKHGAYKFGKGETAAIRIDVLESFQKELPGFPIVVHGSSAVPTHIIHQINSCGGTMKNAIGLADESVREAVNYTICKVNIDTDLRLAVTGAIRQLFRDDSAEFEPMVYMGHAREAVSKMVQHKNMVLNGVEKARLFNDSQRQEAGGKRQECNGVVLPL